MNSMPSARVAKIVGGVLSGAACLQFLVTAVAIVTGHTVVVSREPYVDFLAPVGLAAIFGSVAARCFLPGRGRLVLLACAGDVLVIANAVLKPQPLLVVGAAVISVGVLIDAALAVHRAKKAGETRYIIAHAGQTSVWTPGAGRAPLHFILEPDPFSLLMRASVMLCFTVAVSIVCLAAHLSGAVEGVRQSQEAGADARVVTVVAWALILLPTLTAVVTAMMFVLVYAKAREVARMSRSEVQGRRDLYEVVDELYEKEEARRPRIPRRILYTGLALVAFGAVAYVVLQFLSIEKRLAELLDVSAAVVAMTGGFFVFIQGMLYWERYESNLREYLRDKLILRSRRVMD